MFALAATAFFLAITAPAYGAGQCAEATILRVADKGTAPSTAPTGASQFFVRITCPEKFSGERGYYLTTDLAESGYATALTAVSLGQTLLLDVEDWAFGSLITQLQLNAPTP